MLILIDSGAKIRPDGFSSFFFMNLVYRTLGVVATYNYKAIVKTLIPDSNMLQK